MAKQTHITWQDIQKKYSVRFRKNFIRLYDDYCHKVYQEKGVIMTKNMFAKESGMCKTHVYAILGGGKSNLSLKTMSKVAVFFVMPLEELLR